MAATFSSIGFGDLSLPQKRELVADLWDELAAIDVTPAMLTKEQWAEIERRRAAVAANPQASADVNEFHKELLRKLGQ